MILTPDDDIPGRPVGTANPEHQPRVPTAAGIPPFCSCGFVGGDGLRSPLLATHLAEHDPSYGVHSVPATS